MPAGMFHLTFFKTNDVDGDGDDDDDDYYLYEPRQVAHIRGQFETF